LQKTSKLRMTRQRRVILEELRRVTTHPSADEVYSMVRRRLPHISLGTVYRNLEILAQCGEIQKFESGGSPRRFDGNPAPHYHIRCLGCNRIADFPVEVSLDFSDGQMDWAGYRVTGHRLEFVGYCPACAHKIPES